jgi:hypothetical protein
MVFPALWIAVMPLKVVYTPLKTAVMITPVHWIHVIFLLVAVFMPKFRARIIMHVQLRPVTLLKDALQLPCAVATKMLVLPILVTLLQDVFMLLSLATMVISVLQTLAIPPPDVFILKFLVMTTMSVLKIGVMLLKVANTALFPLMMVMPAP